MLQIRKIEIESFTNTYVLDLSVLPTGTHKYYLAKELVEKYLHSDKRLSIISAGSAAVSIQTFLNFYNRPPLKVLIDNNLNKEAILLMKECGCELFNTNLSEKSLTSNDILKLTNNIEGIDLTSENGEYYKDILDAVRRFNPEVCIVPFGSGQLYSTLKNSSSYKLYGVTTKSNTSKAFKLFSSYLPFNNLSADKNIYSIEETYLEEGYYAMLKNNLNCEYSSAASTALLLQHRESFKLDSKILLISTGKTS